MIVNLQNLFALYLMSMQASLNKLQVECEIYMYMHMKTIH